MAKPLMVRRFEWFCADWATCWLAIASSLISTRMVLAEWGGGSAGRASEERDIPSRLRNELSVYGLPFMALCRETCADFVGSREGFGDLSGAEIVTDAEFCERRENRLSGNIAH